MIHTLRTTENTIYVYYADEINEANSATLKIEILDIVNLKSNFRYNVVLDVSNAHVVNSKTMIQTAQLIKPFIKQFNNAYIIGAKGIQVSLAKMFFNLLTISSLKKRIFFCKDLLEAEAMIKGSWLNYKRKLEKSNGKL